MIKFENMRGLAVLSIVLLLVPFASAFTIFGFDVGDFFSSFFSSNTDRKMELEAEAKEI